MTGRLILLMLVLLVFSTSASSAANQPKMRPYSGIGILILQAPGANLDAGKPFQLYEEPGIFRLGELNIANTTGNEWVFGPDAGQIPLVVTARKGKWLRICYDDAGREAWINTSRRGSFQPWERFLKGRFSRMLPGLGKEYYQMHQYPDSNPLSALTPKQMFKVIKLDDDWVMVMSDQNKIGWLRWRDDDGRLLVGVGPEPK